VSLPLVRPSLRRHDFDQVLDAMVHDRLASGEVANTARADIGKSLGLKETYLLASVRDALHRLMKSLGLQGGDKVVLSPLAPSYWAKGLEELGLVPLFADVRQESPVISVDAVRPLLSREPKALVVDCCLGFVPEMEALCSLGLPVVEDVSSGLGGVYNGKPVGTWGSAVLMFFSPETLVAGAGGCFLGFRSATPEPPVAFSWESLSDLGSALILSQWKDLGGFAEKKKEHFRYLYHRLPRVYRQPKQMGNGEPVLPWFPVLVDSGAKDVLAYCRKKAVDADWAFRNQPYLNAETSGDFCPHARSFLFHTLIFPLYSTISAKDLELLGKVISSLP